MNKEINTSFDFLDSLLLKHNISLHTLSDYAEEHMQELNQAENIFNLKEEKDIKLCLCLFRLMAERFSAEISECFCKRYNISDSKVDDITYEKNKLFLLAAFVYNPSFFSMSWNLCGIIRSELAIQKEAHKNVNSNVTVIQLFFFVKALAAGGANETIEKIWDETIDQEGICGQLQIKANNKNNAGKLQFFFKFKEYHPKPPCHLVIHFITESDKIVYTAEIKEVLLNSSRNKELVIASSELDGIRYTGGIKITGMEVHKHE